MDRYKFEISIAEKEIKAYKKASNLYLMSMIACISILIYAVYVFYVYPNNISSIILLSGFSVNLIYNFGNWVLNLTDIKRCNEWLTRLEEMQLRKNEEINHLYSFQNKILESKMQSGQMS